MGGVPTVGQVTLEVRYSLACDYGFHSPKYVFPTCTLCNHTCREESVSFARAVRFIWKDIPGLCVRGSQEGATRSREPLRNNAYGY